MRDVTMTTSTMGLSLYEIHPQGAHYGCCSHHIGLDICLDECNCCHDVLQARLIQGTGHLNFLDMCIYGSTDTTVLYRQYAIQFSFGPKLLYLSSIHNNKKTFYSVLFISIADMVALCLCEDTTTGYQQLAKYWKYCVQL